MSYIKKRAALLFLILAFPPILAPVSAAAAREGGDLRIETPDFFGLESISFLRSTDNNPEWSEPITRGDQIIIASSRKSLVTFGLDGKKRFSAKLGFAPVARGVVHDGRLYIGGGDGAFHCIDISTGDKLWDEDFKSLDFSPPAVTGGLVIFQTSSDLVVALDAETGAWTWEHQHLRKEDLTVRGLGAPVPAGDVVYVGLSDGYVVALDQNTGRRVWKNKAFEGEQFKDVDAPLVIDDTYVFASSVSGQLSCLSRKTGKVFWTRPVGGMSGFVAGGDSLYVSGDDGEVARIDRVSGQISWTTKLTEQDPPRYRDLLTRPVLLDDTLFVVNRYGKVFALDPATGAVLASRSFFSDTSASPVRFGEEGMLFLDNRGIVRLWPDNPIAGE